MSISFLRASLYSLLYALLNISIGILILPISEIFDRLAGIGPISCPQPESYKLLLSLTAILPVAATYLLARILHRFQNKRQSETEIQSGPDADRQPDGANQTAPAEGAYLNRHSANIKNILFGLIILPTLSISLIVLGQESAQIARTILPLEELHSRMLQLLSPCGGHLDMLGAFITIGLIGPLCEELIFRGLLLPGMLRFYSRKRSILFSVFLQALLFGIIHFNPLQLVFAIIAGIVLGYLRVWSGTLTVPILIHVLVNSSQVLLMFFFPDIPYLGIEEPGQIEHIPLFIVLPSIILLTGGMMLARARYNDTGSLPD